METIGNDLRQMQRTPLAASHVEALRAAGKVVTHSARVFLARPGEPMDRFIYIEDGEVEVVNPYTDERHLPFTLGPTQFMGEISLLNGGAGSLTMRAVRETRVIEVQRGPMLTLMSRIPEMSLKPLIFQVKPLSPIARGRCEAGKPRRSRGPVQLRLGSPP